jgi:hypothetical protein
MLHLELESAVPHISLVFREMWDSTDLSLWLSMHPMHLAVNSSGIPHLAKNERDMGHPSLVTGRETNKVTGSRDDKKGASSAVVSHSSQNRA